MKKILSLILAIAMLFCFAACGGSDSTDSSAEGTTGATSIKFSAESYEVRVNGYKMVSDGIVIEPAGAKVVYESSDNDVATISKKGEVNGLKEGTVTITAKSEDGKVSATCTVVVKGFGSIVARDAKTGEGGITQKRYNAPEAPDDTNAIIVIISKNVDKSADKTIVTTLDYGTRNEDGYYNMSGEGFYVTRNNDKGNYLLEDVPTGEYVGLIICSKDYTNYKSYDNSTIASTLKASKLSEVLSDAEIEAIAGCAPIQSREFYVSEFSVEAEQTTVFGHAFRID
jgi:hypothetical protein